MSNTIGKQNLVQDKFLKTEGTIIIFDLDPVTGLKTGKGLRLGSCESIAIGTTSTLQEYKETQSGLNQTVKTINTEIQSSLELALLNISSETVPFLTAGSKAVLAAATAETLEFEAFGGSNVDLGSSLIDASTVVITSGSGPVVTYEEGKNYVVDNSGVVVFLKAAEQTAKGATVVISDTVGVDVTATFNTVKTASIVAGQNASVEKFVLFSGYNVITNEYFKLECPKVSFSPSESLGLLAAEAGAAAISGRALVSNAYPELGAYRITMLEA